jgi:mono/diheme cytochrome c family protein
MMKPMIPTLLATLLLSGAALAEEAAPEATTEATTEAETAATAEATAVAEAEATPPASEDAPPGTAQSLPLTQTITDIITDPPDAAAAEADAGALTDAAAPGINEGGEVMGFTEGKDIYQYLCRGCHQYDGSGASGAGAYPALAGNENLEFGDYPVTLVVNGQKGMPPLGHMLSDEQVVAVVTYIQTSFGNTYTEHPTVDTVAGVRPAAPAATEGGSGGN